MKNKITGIVAKICVILGACFLFASFSPSLDGRAVVVDDGVFPKGLFAKTVGYLPGDIISVANISGDATVDLLVIGALDPSEGVAIMLSPEAAQAIGIKKNDNNIVKITKRSGQDERVYGTAVIAKSDVAEDKSVFAPEVEEPIDQTPVVEEEIEEEVEESVEDFVEEEIEEETFEDFEEEQPLGPIPTEEETVEEEVEEDWEEETVEESDFEEIEEEEPVYEEVEDELIEDDYEFETIGATPYEETEEEPELDEVVEAEAEEEAVEEEAVEEEPIYEEFVDDEITPVEDSFEEVSEEEYAEEELPEVEAPVESEYFEDEELEEIPAEEDTEILASDIENEEFEDEFVEEEPAAEEPTVEEVEEPAVEEIAEEPAIEEFVEEDSLEPLPYEEAEEEYEAIVLVPAEDNPPVAEELDVIEGTDEDEVEFLDESVEIEETVLVVPEPEVIAEPEPEPMPEVKVSDYSSALEKYMVPSLNDLKKSSYYIQIASMSNDENIMAIIEKYGKNYPITIVPSASGKTKQVMIGPVTMDEYKVILERFKSYGYKDAFLRKVN